MPLLRTLVLVLVCCPLTAAELRGVVRTLDGPLPGVTVSVVWGLATQQHVVTGESGAYAFSDLPAAAVTVEFKLSGFRRLRRTICTNASARYDPLMEVDVPHWTAPVDAPPPRKRSTVRGSILDQSGAPVAGAAVLKFVNGRFAQAAKSRSDGTFILRHIPVYDSIFVVMPGFVTERFRVESAGRRSVSVYLIRECS